MTSIALTDIVHHYGDVSGPAVPVVGPLSLEIANGEAVALVGPSGCGKSTLLRIIAGLVRPSSGDVTANGQPVTGPGPDRGLVFQQNALFPWLSVTGNVGFGLTEAGNTPGSKSDRVAKWIEAVGLSEHADKRPAALSGGMAQRVALARALAPEPGALLLDEPFGSLDRLTRNQMQELLAEVWARTQATLVLVTHDVEEALVLADRVIVLSPRPAGILVDQDVPLDRPRDRAMRLSDPFLALRRELENALETAHDPIRPGQTA